MTDAANAVLVESTIADCATSAYGGGLYAQLQANITVKGSSHVENCTAAVYGGAMYIVLASDFELLEGSVISQCHANVIGGGLYVRPGCKRPEPQIIGSRSSLLPHTCRASEAPGCRTRGLQSYAALL